MNKKGLQILDYYKIISMLAEKASSNPASSLELQASALRELTGCT